MNITNILPVSVLVSHLLFACLLFLIAAVITRFMLRRGKIMDVPNQRSSHSSPTPKSGGVAIVVTFLIGVAAIYLVGDATSIRSLYFGGFLVSSLFIAGISFYDDIRYRSFGVKLGVQALAACIIMAFDVVIDQVALPHMGTVQLGLWAYPITLLWIVGLTNAFNFMDGLDGLAAGTAALVSLFFGLISSLVSAVYSTSFL